LPGLRLLQKLMERVNRKSRQIFWVFGQHTCMSFFDFEITHLLQKPVERAISGNLGRPVGSAIYPIW